MLESLKLIVFFLFFSAVFFGCHKWPGHVVTNDLPYAVKIFGEKEYESKWLDETNTRPNHHGFANICGIGYIYEDDLERAHQKHWYVFRADTGEFLYKVSVEEIKEVLAGIGRLHLRETGITNGEKEGVWRQRSIKEKCEKIYNSQKSLLRNSGQLNR